MHISSHGLRVALGLSLPLALLTACNDDTAPATATPSASAVSMSAPRAQPLAAASLRDTASDTWVGTDALGRGLPLQEIAGGPKAGKFVGMFYHLWEPAEEVFDITKILRGQGGWGPRWAFHWWSEPYFGYYYRDDDHVLRKHAQLLTDAGVDAIFIDSSNGLEPTRADYQRMLHLCEVYSQMRAEGRKTPQISFLTGDDPQLSGDATHFLHDNFYQQRQCAPLWFQWQGKPLILANMQNVKPEVRAFFTTRRSWAFSAPDNWFGDGRDRWPWLDNYPQPAGWHDSPARPEELAVGAGQGPLGNVGRSFHAGRQPASPSPEQGLFFAEQWRRAHEVNPDVVLVAGWNEWIAQRFVHGQDSYTGPMAGRALNDGDSYFVDAYSQEYSRDIEPMRGGHGDNHYYQLVDNIRRFKGVRAVPGPTEPKTIAINPDFSQWNGVGPDYIDDIGDASHRNRPGSAQRTYRNESGRNDIAVARVARDPSQLYFYVRTTAPMTAPSGNWMTLYLNTDGNGGNGWNGFEYAVNRDNRNGNTGTLARHAGNDRWETVAEVAFVYRDNELHFALPRSTLGLGSERGALNFDFKWADNGPTGGDPIAFIDQGDAAPNGRFSYRYQEAGTTLPPPTGLLPLDQHRSLQVLTPGFTNRYLHHQDGLGRTEVVNDGSAALLKTDATIKVVRGLADGNCYSFEARHRAGSFLRHRDFRLRLDANDNTEVFRNDATFCARHGLGGSGVSLESRNMPGFFIRHIDSEVWVARLGGSNAADAHPASFNQDASWRVATPLSP